MSQRPRGSDGGRWCQNQIFVPHLKHAELYNSTGLISHSSSSFVGEAGGDGTRNEGDGSDVTPPPRGLRTDRADCRAAPIGHLGARLYCAHCIKARRVPDLARHGGSAHRIAAELQQRAGGHSPVSWPVATGAVPTRY
jgi:hypothetical protein